MFRFASPYYFLFLLWIPLWLYYKKKRRIYPAIGVSGVSGVKSIEASMVLKLRWIVPAVKYTALCLLITAVARPQWGTRQVDIKTEGINIILAVDLSESMAALDFKVKGKVVNRLEAVKGVVTDFVSKRDGDRIGMVVFGSHAYTQIPLTRDYGTILSILEKLRIGSAGKSTAIGDAIGISVKRIEDIKSKSNVIILLTDGRSNAGELSPDIAADIASGKDIKIYTVGVGSKGKAPFLVKDSMWGERYVYQRVDIDEDTLKEIARKTIGQYFRAGNTEKLKEIYDTIDAMEKTEIEIKTHAEYRELYSYILIAGFLLLAMWVALSNTRFLRVP